MVGVGMTAMRLLVGAAVLAAALAALPTAAGLDWWAANLPGHSTETLYDGTIAITNTGTATETVDIFDSTGLVTTLTVPALDSTTWTMSDRLDFSQKTFDGSYRVATSDRVIVAEFFPIDNSPKNDALAVLDETRLGLEYYTFNFMSTPPTDVECREMCRQFVTIVGTQPGTTVTVTPTAPITPGGGVPAIGTGSPYTTTLAGHEVLHLEAVGPNFDLTGTHVLADQPVAVFTGVACLGIYKTSCDQVSEQVFPVEYAGDEYVICSGSEPGFGWNNEDRIRVMATAPGTTTGTIAGTGGGTFTLTGAGDWREFTTEGHLYIDADKPILVSQIYSPDAAGTWVGDPSLVIHVPTSQYLETLSFISPKGDGLGRPTWTNYAYIARTAGSGVALDGSAVGAAVESVTGTSAYECLNISPTWGTHFLTTTGAMSVHVFGDASPTTYGYLGFGVFSTDFDAVITGCGTAPVVFTDLSTQTVALRRSSWDWGDGTSSTVDPWAATITHAFPGAGTYTVTLTVTDAFRRDRSATMTITVPECPAPPAPPPPFVADARLTVFACDGPARIQMHAGSALGEGLWWRADGLPPDAAFYEGALTWAPMERLGTWPVRVTVYDIPPWEASDDLDAWDHIDRRMASAVLTVTSLPCVESPYPAQTDADGDGVPDRHDDCPMVENPGGQGQVADCAMIDVDAGLGYEPEPVVTRTPAGLRIDGCLLSLPQQVRADRFPDDQVRVRWTWDGLCPLPCPQDGQRCLDIRFAVWNDTVGKELVAVVPYKANGGYEVWDVQPWRAQHRYEVQVLFEAGAPVHDLQAIMPTNRVDACFCAPPMAEDVPPPRNGNDDTDPENQAGLDGAHGSKDIPALGAPFVLACAGAAWVLRRQGMK